MTIAVGLLSKDGVVIAADTEVTAGNHKLNQSKCMIAHRHRDAMAISGAGSVDYLQSVYREICEGFVTPPNPQKPFSKFLKAAVSAFHFEHVVPLSHQSDHPTFELVVGAILGGKRRLWTSRASSIYPHKHYGSVGYGWAYGSEMLNRYWKPGLDKTSAICLATYVASKVKEGVPYCGDRTQVIYIDAKGAQYIEQGNIQLIERIFQDHTGNGNRMLHYILGLEPSSAKNEFIVQLAPPVRPLDEPEFIIGEDD